MAELKRGDKEGENAEHGGERCQERYCKDCYPMESSYLVRGEDKLIGRREGRYTYEIPFVVMLVSATAIPKTAEDVSNSNTDSQSNRALTHSCQVYGFLWVIMCG